MDNINSNNDFSLLTADQIQGLVESIQDAFGGDFSRPVFSNHLLALLEDIPGFETGDAPASLIEAAWALYRTAEAPGGCE
ncbi:hypothetical protein [Paraburkholderia sp.]|uniref:hypothetical protein n=1 Tax=Paraburkholderia sp. TaxID=1926495 RepID=UPI0025DF5A80|nr:hypothetical protein [Paraburkholderia sp.]